MHCGYRSRKYSLLPRRSECSSFFTSLPDSMNVPASRENGHVGYYCTGGGRNTSINLRHQIFEAFACFGADSDVM
jgi:hypothetical protein